MTCLKRELRLFQDVISLVEEILANICLYGAINFAGMYTKYLTDRGQRKAFVETYKSMETRFKTQVENDKQEKLLLSGEWSVNILNLLRKMLARYLIIEC